MYLLLMRRTYNQTDGASVGVILFLYPIMQFDAVTNFVTLISFREKKLFIEWWVAE